MSDTKRVSGSEFVRRVEVRWTSHRGKGSHGLLYYGSEMTTVRNFKDEVGKRAFHNMLKQLCLSETSSEGDKHACIRS